MLGTGFERKPESTKFLEMKKLVTLFTLAAMFAIVSCGPSAQERAAAEKAKLDSIAAAQAQAYADSVAAAEAVADTTVVVE